jgi:hypothetical protein
MPTLIFGQVPLKNDIFLMNYYYVRPYRLQNIYFIMINNIFGTEEINRKQSSTLTAS